MPTQTGTDSAFTEQQLGAFRAILEQIRQRGVTLPLVHTANSAAIVRFPEAHTFHSCVPASCSTGTTPCRPQSPLPISDPSSHYEPRSSNCGLFHEGEQSATTGHSSRHDRRVIAVLPIGYADGYSRRLSHRGSVLIQGRRAPIVGLVCMDMIMVDVTDLAPVQVGETVTLIGQQGGESIWADEVADWIDTIPYEVLCGIGSRVPRLYESA